MAKGTLKRTDGRTDEDDRAEAVSAAQTNLDKVLSEVDAEPLTRDELELFGSLSQRELSHRYYGPDGDAICEFAVRYRKASREFGYVIPPKFSGQATESTGSLELTATQYHAIPAAELQRKLREPRFKFAVMQLIKTGQI